MVSLCCLPLQPENEHGMTTVRCDLGSNIGYTPMYILFVLV